MKLNNNEFKIVIEALEDFYYKYKEEETETLLYKLQDKHREIQGKEERLLSNSEIKNIGI